MNGGPGFLRTYAQFLRLETTIEGRNAASLLTALLFSVALAFLFRAALGESASADPRSRAGLTLAAIYCAAALSAARRVHAESEAGAWRIQMLSPADQGAVFLAKASVGAVHLCLLSFAVAPLFAWLLAGYPEFALRQALVLALASLATAPLLTLSVYVGRGTGARELITPALLLPASIPIFLVAASALRFAGAAQWPPSATIIALLAFAALYSGLGVLLFPLLVREE